MKVREVLDRGRARERIAGVHVLDVVRNSRANWQFEFFVPLGLEQLVVMPISTLYARPRTGAAIWFCAFHPKRADRAVVAVVVGHACDRAACDVKFGLPLIPSVASEPCCSEWFAAIGRVGICSMSPAPNGRGGMRRSRCGSRAGGEFGCARRATRRSGPTGNRE